LQILQLYDQLMAIASSPIVALNRAVAAAEVEGPGVALALVDDLEVEGYLLRGPASSTGNSGAHARIARTK